MKTYQSFNLQSTRYFLLFVLLPVWCPLFSSGEAHPLEKQLASASGVGKAAILETLSDYYRDSNYEKALALGLKALKIREQTAGGDPGAEHYNRVAILEVRLSQYMDAERHTKIAQSLAEKAKDSKSLALALFYRGRANKYIPNYPLAIECLTKSGDIYKELNDSIHYASCLNNLGLVYRRICSYTKSLSYLLKALVIYNTFDDKPGISSVANNIGLIYLAMDKYDDALNYFEISRKYSEEIRDEPGAAISWANIAHIYDIQGKYREALLLYYKTLAVKKKFNDPAGEATVLIKMGQHHRGRKNHLLAMDYFNRALRIKEKIHETYGIANVLLESGSLLRVLGQRNEAESRLSRALELSEQINAVSFTRDAARELSQHFETLNQDRLALFYYKKYRDADIQLTHHSNAEQTALLQNRYEIELKESEINLLKKDNKIRDLDLKRSLYLRNFLLIITILTLILGVMSYMGYRLKNKVNAALKESELNFRFLLEKRTRELEAAQRELVLTERLSVLGQLTATVAHEIRTPLAAVRSSVFTIKTALDNNNPDRIQRALELSERNIIRCDNFIAELLDLTKRKELRRGMVRLSEWLNSLLDEYSFPAGFVIKREFQETPPVNADSERLRRAVNNLLQNAIRALLQADKPEKRITVSTRFSENNVEMVIRDNGPGIAPEVMPHIFEPLFTTRSFGFGLGLTVVKAVMEEHGGHVEIHSARNNGTEAILRLPI